MVYILAIGIYKITYNVDLLDLNRKDKFEQLHLLIFL